MCYVKIREINFVCECVSDTYVVASGDVEHFPQCLASNGMFCEGGHVG